MTIIGIDLGTTNSLCAVFHENSPQLVPNVHGSFLTPSVVAKLDDGQVIMGESAKELRVTRPEICASRFKRLMGTQESITLGGQKFSAPELSSIVLRSLKSDAERFYGTPIRRAVITVPAYFNDHQRKATRFAGELADLEVVRIINEPTAAALTYGFHDRDSQKKFMVIDLGGGTFDVTIMDVFERMLEIVSTSGESMLGGEDFTDRMVSKVLSQFGHVFEVVELKHPLQLSRLRQLCEAAKIAFFSADMAELVLPDELGNLDSSRPIVEVHRAEFAAWMNPLLERLLGPIQRAMRDAGLVNSRLDDVILVGGATRMICLQDFVAEHLKCTPQAKYNPDEVVALGAAVQAALISEDRAVEDMVMTDVCPHTLGIEISKSMADQLMDGFFEPIIHRNTTIPVSRQKAFQTLEINQRSVNVKVYQGENRKSQDNVFLGEMVVDGIPPGPAGSKFDVRFTYDTNGILEVEAIIPSTGKSFRKVIENPGVNLSKQEIMEAVRKMQAVKFYPRDQLENQLLLRFCTGGGSSGPARKASVRSIDRRLGTFAACRRSRIF